MVTRGKDGLAVFRARTAGTRRAHIPIYGSDAPVDVTGAGDTVIAVFTLALAAGAVVGRGRASGELRGRHRGDEAPHGDGDARGARGGSAARVGQR